MQPAKKVMPFIIILGVTLGLSYYLFSIYKPSRASEVRGTASIKEKKDYISTLPLPSESKEIGRNAREGFFQLTVSSSKSANEIQQFFKNVLTEKGWNTKGDSTNTLSAVYTRDNERVEVSVLSFDGSPETVFSISHSE